MAGVGELPGHFVSQVFRLADMTKSGDLDMEAVGVSDEMWGEQKNIEVP